MHYEFLGTRGDAGTHTTRAKRELGVGERVPYPFYGEISDRVRSAQERLLSSASIPVRSTATSVR